MKICIPIVKKYLPTVKICLRTMKICFRSMKICIPIVKIRLRTMKIRLRPMKIRLRPTKICNPTSILLLSDPYLAFVLLQYGFCLASIWLLSDSNSGLFWLCFEFLKH